MQTTRKRLRTGVSATAFLAMVLVGCTTTGSERLAQLGMADTTDACYQQRISLADEQDYFAESIVATAFAGAAMGAVLGGLGAAITGGDIGTGLVVGGIAGTLTGAAAGYWDQLRQREANELGMLQKVSADINQENERISSFNRKFNALVDCRRGAVRKIEADLAAGAITREQARTQLVAQKRAYEDDLRLGREINGNIQSRSSEFVEVSEQINPGISDQLDPDVRRATTTVNVRAQPSTESGVLGQVRAGDRVVVSSVQGDWLRIVLADRTRGFAYGSYFVDEEDYRAPPPVEPQVAANSALVDTPAEQQAAAEVQRATFANANARRSTEQSLQEAEAFNDEFDGLISTV